MVANCDSSKMLLMLLRTLHTLVLAFILRIYLKIALFLYNILHLR
jgi:hypothetical protein